MSERRQDGAGVLRRLARSVPGTAPSLVVVALLVASSGALAVTYDQPRLGEAAVDDSPDGSTLVSTQGWNARGVSLPGRPARLVSLDASGDVEWEHDGPADRESWFYDVDPLANGNLLVVNPVPGDTVVYEYDPDSGERVWTERFDLPDVHDVDLINGDELLVAGISYGGDGPSRDRVFVYDRSAGEVTWEWRFRDHYPDDAGEGVRASDWTHVNDVDKVGDGLYMASPRNLDQVVVVNRSTGDIEARLGEDGNHSTLYEQHNPNLFRSEDGTPTILVADSENDRVVEYERDCEGPDGLVAGDPADCTWELTWELTGDLNWPRDADRLPNGNTLVVDSMNHRVIEVAPDGEIVWEASVPWATYDAERTALGDEPGGPTMADLGATGRHELTGGRATGAADHSPAPTVGEVLTDSGAPPPLSRPARRALHVVPWVTPTWLPTWSGLLLAGAGLVLAGRWAGRRVRPPR